MAELGFVLIFVIQSFHSVMRPPALVLLGAFFSVCKLAQLWGVVVIISSLVLDGVVVIAALVIVCRILLKTLYSFEVLQIQVLQL